MKQSINTTNSMQTAFEANENLSLRKVAAHFDVNYNMLLKASKKPIEGQIYDPTAFNYSAVETYLSNKIGIETYQSIDWAEVSDIATTIKVQLTKEFEIGQSIKLRGDEAIYIVAMLTSTHIVIMAENSTQPRVMNLGTFMHQGPKNV